MAIDLSEGEMVYLDGAREASVVEVSEDRVKIRTEDDSEEQWVAGTDLTLEPLGR